MAASSFPATSICGPAPKQVTLDFPRPGKPTGNGVIEAFNSKLGLNV
jgi:transposase InsO family protein